MPEPYVREPTDFIPDSEDTFAATSREVTQANISQNNGTAEETNAQQRPKVVSLVCRAHEGQLSAALYSIKPTQLVSLKYLISNLSYCRSRGPLCAEHMKDNCQQLHITSNQLSCTGWERKVHVTHSVDLYSGQILV